MGGRWVTGWVPGGMVKGEARGHMAARNGRAGAAGLGFRPLEVTVQGTLQWWQSVPAERRETPGFSITPELEARVLAAWRARASITACTECSKKAFNAARFF